MAESSLIRSYLTELRYTATRLADVDDIVAEAEDHLLAAVDAAVANGSSRVEAETEALARFGSAALVGRTFIEEAKRGGAVSTRITRLAGAAAMAVPLLFGFGQFGNIAIERGVFHGASLVLLAAGFVGFAFALWGLRVRHGGMGAWGRAAFWLFVASPFIAAPFLWAAGAAFIVVQLIVVALLGVGMLRARILPMTALALFAFTPTATVAAGLAFSTGSGLSDSVIGFGLALSSLGLAWVGWAMWREPALDVRTSSGSGPLAAT